MAEAAQLRTLLGLKQPGKPGRIVIWDTEEVCVGRSSENDLLLEDSDASRRHALFTRTYSVHTVQDLGTANGTQVNGETIREPRELANKDMVRICDLELTFIQTRKDPAALGLEVVYASQLKAFAGGEMAGDPGATTLGLLDPVKGAFDVGSVGDFDTEGPGVAPAPVPAAPRDLDLEFATWNDDDDASTPASGTFSLTLELDGLGSELTQTLQSMLGKVIELPSLRVRIKGGED